MDLQLNNAPGTIIGTPGPGGNVISANGGNGIAVHGAASTGVLIQGNRIGTTPTGAPLGNAGHGIEITAPGVEVGWRDGDPAVPMAGNLISGNAGDGLQLLGPGATGNRVRGNRIGTNLAGTAALGSGAPTDPFSNYQGIYVTGPSNIIGGPQLAERNLLSGNRIDGIYVDGANATGNLIEGNYLGTDASGTVAIANGFEGIGLISAPGNTVNGNLVSGNARYGLYVFGDGNTIAGNTIGAADGGSTPLGNLAGGIYIAASNTRVGVASPNVIAFNTGNGVTVVSGTGNEIANNTISANTLMGIDLRQQRHPQRPRRYRSRRQHAAEFPGAGQRAQRQLPRTPGRRRTSSLDRRLYRSVLRRRLRRRATVRARARSASPARSCRRRG